MRSHQDGAFLINSAGQFTDISSVPELLGLQKIFPPYRHNRVIQRHRANTPQEFLNLIAHFNQIAGRLKRRCFFRGQFRNYFAESGQLSVLPAGLRPTCAKTPFFHTTLIEEVQEQLTPWLDVLEAKLGIDLGDCLRFEEIEPGSGWGLLRFWTPHVLSGKKSSDGLMGILQHYGFPTYCLDVTDDPLVALWFALHQAYDVNGEIGYRIGTPDPARGWPSTMIFIESEDSPGAPIVDLRSISALQGVARRPFAQRAFLLPFKTIHHRQPAEAIWTLEKSAKRIPVAHIEIAFAASEAYLYWPKFRELDLVPLDDPLYLSLFGHNVPHLAVYEGTQARLSSGELQISSWKAPETRTSAIDEPIPGSVASNPQADIAYKRVAELLNESNVTWRGSSFSAQDVYFFTELTISHALSEKLLQVQEDCGVYVYVGPKPDDW